ncbi:MAG: diaminopimelate epimerase [Elusimicrobiales bacterium]
MLISFFKITAAGNDFILFFNLKKLRGKYLEDLARKVCSRNYGIGADGILVLKKKGKEFYLDYLNSDGSYAFCGNGTRAAALWINKRFGNKNFQINTSAGRLCVVVRSKNVYVEMPSASFIKNMTLDVKDFKNGFYVKTGSYHLVIFSKRIDTIDILNLGRYFRYHKDFKPFGVNVNFVELIKKTDFSASFKIRTYEKGVETETLSCSSGIASSFYAAEKIYGIRKAEFITKNNERFFIEKNNNRTFISGPLKIICMGRYYYS